MRKFGRRFLSLSMLILAFSCVTLVERPALAQTGNWEYRPELGGYVDWDTGLVWGEEGGLATWDIAVAHAAKLSTDTGKPWRLPTVAESQVAAAHSIYWTIPSVYGRGICWTSDAKNKGGAKFGHYEIFFWSGEIRLVGNNSLIDTIPVYGPITP